MRPGSNKRMRGRNRRGPNPLARSYESNGPDVKVRGTAQHIADRYLQLARDAQSSGDPVTAESYFQHAEHYLRIIAAAQDQMQAQYGYRPRTENGVEEEGDGEEGEAEAMGTPYQLQNGGYNGQPRQMPPSQSHNGPSDPDDQPPMFSPPRERFDNRNPRFGDREGWQRQHRGDGNRYDNRRDNYRQDGHRREPYRRDESAASSPDFAGDARGPQGRGGQGEGGGEQHGLERRSQNPAHQGSQGGHGREDRRERFERPARAPAREEEQALPSFITAPVRPAAPAAETADESPSTPREAGVTASAAPDAGGAPAPRAKRGRPRRAAEPATNGEDGASASDGTGSLEAK
ncbi:MAG: DUF4167 domain-containing protein [Hyphomicrobiales bacterium]|nr:DUF4167 domain-containing protein [Hyphomicrobiales bacterium]